MTAEIMRFRCHAAL